MLIIMGIVITLVTIVIILAAVRFLPINKNQQAAVLGSPTPTSSESPSPTPSPTPAKTVKPKNSVSIMITTPTPQASSAPMNQGDISEFIYPNSNIVSQSGSSLDLTSSDSPDAIANWYKAKIKSKNMNINTFVTTNVNDKVVDKLVGDSASASVSVEIDKDAGNNQVSMKINI